MNFMANEHREITTPNDRFERGGYGGIARTPLQILSKETREDYPFFKWVNLVLSHPYLESQIYWLVTQRVRTVVLLFALRSYYLSSWYIKSWGVTEWCCCMGQREFITTGPGIQGKMSIGLYQTRDAIQLFGNGLGKTDKEDSTLERTKQPSLSCFFCLIVSRKEAFSVAQTWVLSVLLVWRDIGRIRDPSKLKRDKLHVTSLFILLAH